jgi:hypothetical protein
MSGMLNYCQFYFLNKCVKCNLVLQASRDGIEPTIVQTYIAGGKGPDLDHPKILCDKNATQK